MYFFRSNVIYFAQKEPIKEQTFETFKCFSQNSSHSCHFWSNKSVFLEILHHSSVSWDITPLYFCIPLSKGAYQSTNLVKFHASSQKSEILHFDGLLCPNHVRFQLKSTEDTEKWCKVLRQPDFWFQIWHKEFDAFSPNHSKIWKFHFNGHITFELKKYRGVIFHDTEQWCKIWINPDLMASEMVWRNGWTFIRALKSLKNCILMGSFCLKHIMFQLENFRGIMCHNTEGWYKI